MPPRLTCTAILLAAAIAILLAFAVADAQVRPLGVPVSRQPAASGTPCVPQRLSVKPIEDLREDASFQQFKRRLLDIAAKRYMTALSRFLSPDFFEVGFCEGGPNYRGADAIAHFKDMIASDPGSLRLVQRTLRVGVVSTLRTYGAYTSERP